MTDDRNNGLFATMAKDPEASAFGGMIRPRTPISEQVANRIMDMIKSGNLKAEDQLPTEAQMATAFGISRPPLREALKALTLMGVLESRQGGRYSVTDLSPARLVAPFNIMLAARDYDVEAHFESRRVVDVAIIRMCAERADDEQRALISRLAADGRKLLNDPVAFRLSDVAFHQALNKGAENPYMASMAQALYDVGLDLRRYASGVPGVTSVSVDQHVAIAQAIADRDPEAAAAAGRAHVEHVRASTVRTMEINASEETS